MMKQLATLNKDSWSRKTATKKPRLHSLWCQKFLKTEQKPPMASDKGEGWDFIL